MINKSVLVTFGMVSLLGLGLFWLNNSDPAPNVSFQTLDGETLSLEAMRGQPVLVVFWATTCAVCVEEMPELVALYRELEPRGLRLVAVAMPYDPPSHVVAMAESRQLPYPVALDINSDLVQAFGNIRYTPSAVLVGPEGQIQKRLVGRLDIAALRGDISALLRPIG